MTQGETLEEVFEAIEDARRGWIQVAYESGQDISLPRDIEEYSGEILTRIPKSLHRNLVCAAKREGVSLNHYVTSLLAAGVQRDILVERREFAFHSPTALFGIKERPCQRDEISWFNQQVLKTE